MSLDKTVLKEREYSMLKRTFNNMVIAQIFSALTIILCLLIDSIMIGRFLGVDAIAAYGLSNPLLLAFAAIGSMISAGVQVQCSKSLGSGDTDSNNTYFSVTVALCVLVAVVGMTAVFTLRGPICELLGAKKPSDLYNMTSDYLLGFIIGAPAFLASTVLVPFLQLAGKQTRLVIAVLSMIVSDVLFDILNVFVFHGGMFGMGLASSLSYYVAFAIGIFYFLSPKCLFKFSKKLVSFSKCKELLIAGIPTIINMISTVLLTFTINKILMHISGSDAVASFSIISTVSNVCYAFPGGIAAVTLMLAGVFYFEDDKNTLHELVKLTLKEVFIVGTAVSVITVICAPFLVNLFIGDNASAADLATIGVRIFGLSLIPSSFTTGLKNYYQGIQRVTLTEVISVLQNFLCIALFAFILSSFFGTNGVWFAYICGEVLTLFIVYLIIRHYNKCNSLSISKIAMLPEYYGVSDDCYLRTNILCATDLSSFTKQVQDFCKKHNANDKCCYYTTLCIEEICSNILSYGFIDNRIKLIDVSVFFKKPELIVRIRDTGTPFDPVAYNDMANADDENNHLGIKMVFKLAKEVKYTNSLSQNSITLIMDSSSFDSDEPDNK